MAARPHRALEAAAGALIPASRREEILGDLSERYTSAWRYLADVVQVVPAIALSESLRAVARRRRPALAPIARQPRGVHVSALAAAARLSAWLATSSPVGRRSLLGLLATAAWFAAASVHARIGSGGAGNDPGDRS